MEQAGAWHSGQQSLIFNVQSHFTKLTRDAYSFRKGSGEVRRRAERGREKHVEAGGGVERHWDFPLEQYLDITGPTDTLGTQSRPEETEHLRACCDIYDH